ncbi:MAG: ATP-binding protein [Acidimicrobiales bacterium]|nr:ATP-binding protein [Acidimicrobiales bacterium]
MLLMGSRVAEAEQLQSLGRLAGGIAHDFNNLLAVISNYTAFVARAIEVTLRTGEVAHLGEAARDIEQIEQAAKRATIRTKQLLAFARRDAARPQPVDISDVVHGALPALHKVRGDSVSLTTSVAMRLPKVFADPVQLEDVLMNVVANACDAMPNGGELHIATQLRFRSEFAGVELIVRDTGLGMAKKVRVQAFEPFFTTKDFGAGAGLGLAIVHGIVTRSGGCVDIESEQGVGTTVTIWLPNRRIQLTAEPTSPQPAVEVVN